MSDGGMLAWKRQKIRTPKGGRIGTFTYDEVSKVRLFLIIALSGRSNVQRPTTDMPPINPITSH